MNFNVGVKALKRGACKSKALLQCQTPFGRRFIENALQNFLENSQPVAAQDFFDVLIAETALD